MSDLSTNPSHLKSNETLELETMGGENGEKTTPKPLLKPGRGKGVFDIAISRLLKDFTSAELLSQTPDSSPKGNTNTNEDTKYETIVSSMKCLHLRRPIIAKERKRVALKRKHLQNSLNLAVAASHFQKPIVWPAKLSSQCKRESSNLINPPRLEISQKVMGCKQNIKSTVSNEGSEKNVILFGSLASTDYSKVSFSSLSEQMNAGKKTDIFKNSSSNESLFLRFDESLSPLSKRRSSGSIPPAKVKKIEDSTDDIAAAPPVFSKYRSGVKKRTDCLLTKPNATFLCWGPETSSGSEAFRPCSSSASLETLATPSSLCASAQFSQWEGSINRSCSQEMRMEETNVNELASYFEDLLHIPRKMSTMAEMMYA